MTKMGIPVPAKRTHVRLGDESNQANEKFEQPEPVILNVVSALDWILTIYSGAVLQRFIATR